MALEPSVRAYAFRQIREGHPSEIIFFPFDIPKAAPWFADTVHRYLKELPYVYVSVLRPVVGNPKWTGEVEGVTYKNPKSGSLRTLYLAAEPQSPDLLERWELTPLIGRTTGRFVLDVAKADGVPVQLMKDMGEKAVLLSKSARRPGTWQLTSFAAYAKGPTGHEEATTMETLEELIGDAVSSGYTTFSEDAVNYIMQS